MNVLTFLKYQYNLNIKPIISEDCRLLNEVVKDKYPYYPCTDDVHVVNGLKWLYNVNKAVNKEGFPSKFSIGANWGLGPSYPETTGYTISTLLTLIRNKPIKEFDYGLIHQLVKDSNNYLLNCQLEGGSFTGGHKGMKNFGQPSIFNTGQILLGLADLYETAKNRKELFSYVELKDLSATLSSAGQFLVDQLEDDGSYKTKYTYLKKTRAYYSRATYGLLRTGIVLDNKEFIKKAYDNFKWVATCCKFNGVITSWGFRDDLSVLHTIAYTLRGQLEAANYFDDKSLLEGVLNGVDFLVEHTSADFEYSSLIPSHFDDQGNHESCLCVTGLSQLAIVLKKIPESSRPQSYDVLFDSIIHNTKKFQLRGFSNDLLNGVMPASYPFNGMYQPNDMIEWGTKFFMDSGLISMGVPASEIKG